MVNAVSSTQVASPLTTNNSSQTSDILIAESCDSRSKYYGKFSDQQVKEASDRVNAKEFSAFISIGNDATLPGIKKYAEAYIKYIDQLSPEDQNSVRYKGTKESMTGVLAQADALMGSEKSTSGKKPKEAMSDIVKMFDAIKIRFIKQAKHSGASTSTVSNTDQVTISEEANKYAASLQSLDRTEA
jgi:hypothetical protein